MKTKLILPKVLLCKAKDNYDLAMHFLRYQEYYESPNPKFRRKDGWKLVEFMDWYRKSRKADSFTYPADWAGFNIPAEVVYEISEWAIPDKNHYDDKMRALAEMVGPNGYLIGAQDKGTVRHEVAHGLFYTNEQYRFAASKLVLGLPPRVFNAMTRELKRMGYAREVITDEIQAYMATGLTKEMKVPARLRWPFQKLFKQHTRGVFR